MDKNQATDGWIHSDSFSTFLRRKAGLRRADAAVLCEEAVTAALEKKGAELVQFDDSRIWILMFLVGEILISQGGLPHGLWDFI